MPTERVAMRHAREIIRLKYSSNAPTREIARRLGLAPSTVRETLKRFDDAGLVWPLPEGMNDGDLEAALYSSRRSKRGHRRHLEPDWPAVHRELKRKHVTLTIVWMNISRPIPAVRGLALIAKPILPARPRQASSRLCRYRVRRA